MKINRCVAVENKIRCSEVPDIDQVLCQKHRKMRDEGINDFDIAIVPLSEFTDLSDCPHFDVDSLVEAQTTGVVKIGGRD